MSFNDIDRRPVAWCLQINGVPYRYCSTHAPAGSVTDGRLYDYGSSLVRSPVDVLGAILDVGPIEGTIDDMAPIAGQSPVDVRIIARDARTAAGARIDPLETLLRVAGPASSTRRVKLAADVPHKAPGDGPFDVEVTGDVSGWTLPGVVHIGHEVLWADSADVAPYRFVDCTRAADRWSAQSHEVDTDHGEQPWATDEVTTWRGRRASIYVSAIDGAGNALGWSRYWEGVIDSPPTFDGRALTVRIRPLTAVASYKLGVGSAARTCVSVAGAHWIRTGANGVADRIRAMARLNITPTRFVVAAANGPAGTVTLSPDGAAYLDSIGHQLSATFKAETQAGGVILAVATSYASPVLSFGAGAQIAVDCAADLAGGIFVAINAVGEYREWMPLQLVDPAGGDDQIVAWPQQLLTVVNEAQAFQTVIDSWADADSLGGDPRQVKLQLKRTAAGEWALLARLVDAGSAGWDGSARVFIDFGGAMLRAGWALGESIGDVRNPHRDIPPGAGAWLDGEVWQRDATGNDAEAFIHDGPAVWYYQRGEPYIGPFDSDVYTGGTQQIEVTGSGPPVRIWITGSTTGTHPETGDTVVWYAVDNPDRAPNIALMEGDAPVTCYVTAAARDSDPGEYVLRLLNSGIGNGDNGADDLMPIGANLPYTAILTGGFGGLAAPPLTRQDYEAVRGRSIAEQCGGLLMACGAQLAQVYSAAADAWRVAVVHMGPADAAQSALTLTDDDLMVSPGRDPVRVEIDGRTVRSYLVRLNYRAGNGTPEEVPVATSTERNDAGADSGEPLALDLPGVEVPGDGGKAQAAAEIVADMRTRVGVPRVRWRLSIRADTPGAIALGLGSVVTLTSAYAIGINPTATADATPCRVVGLARDLMENRLDLELRPFSGQTAGWAQSARVATVIDADSLTVQAAEFSEDDASHFLAGHKVSVFAPGAWSARAAKTLASVSGVTFNFTAAHGASVGDIIRCDDYATATAAQKAQAFIAAADGTIGADPGYVLG